MAAIDFSTIDAKLRRAQVHREELRRLVEHDARAPERRVLLEAELDEESGFHVFRICSISTLDDLVETISLVTGDFVHNTRSALDHFAWQLACVVAGGMPSKPKDVALPICTGFTSKGNPAHKNPDFLSMADWNRIHEWQPCRGVNGRADSWSGDYIHLLKLLSDLWILDKHQRLPVVLLTSNEFSTVPTRSGHPPWLVEENGAWPAGFSRVGDPDPLADEIDFDCAGRFIAQGVEVVRIKVTSWYRDVAIIKPAGYCTPRVALEGHRPLLPTLDRLTKLVELMLNQWR